MFLPPGILNLVDYFGNPKPNTRSLTTVFDGNQQKRLTDQVINKLFQLVVVLNKCVKMSL